MFSVALHEPLHERSKISQSLSGETQGASPARQLDPSVGNAGQGVDKISALLMSGAWLYIRCHAQRRLEVRLPRDLLR